MTDIRPEDTTDLTPSEEAALVEREDDLPPESPPNDTVEEPT
jgi:hypothetical protein